MIDLSKLLKKEYQKRYDYLNTNNLTLYRLFSPQMDLPCAIDIYGTYAVIHLFDLISTDLIAQIEKTLADLLKIEEFFYKNRTRGDIDLPKSPHREFIGVEYGHQFLINLSDYLDTGLFLDHRETRKWIAEKCEGRTVLNTFAYTGSFSIYAAKAGAVKTYTVDLSKTYCEWFKKNLELNGLPPEKNWTYKMDTIEFFKYAGKKGLKFDIIIIDPPTFSRNKGQSFSVQKDHPQLINSALELLNPGGMIMFSTNCVDFKLAKPEISAPKINSLDLIPFDFKGTTPHRSFLIYK
jgi:23S rRNA (cytosine1962-C5)-methyltransferase